MKTVELFCGTKSFSKYAKKLGHETFTIDNNPELNPDLCTDLSNIDITNGNIIKKLREADIIWMSPPCTTFSMASGNTHWTADRKPKTKEAELGKRLIELCDFIAMTNNDKIWFIENPRARWFLPTDETRHTVWYCQYGDKRAKPTDIWTNLKNWNHKQCKNNNPNCNHERAPRGSKTGTQGLKGAKERGVIPEALFKEIFNVLQQNEPKE